MDWLSVLLALLTLFAVCRLTRLVVEDTITQPFRDWVARHAHSHPSIPGRPDGRTDGRPAVRVWRWADKLLSCPWCSGFWISAAATAAYFRCWLGYWPHTTAHWFAYTAGTFAASWLSAILADWLDSPPPPRTITLTPFHADVTHRNAPPN